MNGEIRTITEFSSKFVKPRRVDIWLPPGFSAGVGQRYPVLYMHDGQNLFIPELSYAGVDWGIDEVMSRLIAEGVTRPAIVVGIWNTPLRRQEYMPGKAARLQFKKGVRRYFQAFVGKKTLSDAYLQFLVDELKPSIDILCPTLPGPADTSIMGSSMGGLISLYAICEYPEVFGGAGCVSTHWPAGNGCMIDYMKQALPVPDNHRIYFDFGTATLDAQYEPWQLEADKVMEQAGYQREKNWLTCKFTGAEHSERAWRERVHIPLEFLLRK